MLIKNNKINKKHKSNNFIITTLIIVNVIVIFIFYKYNVNMTNAILSEIKFNSGNIVELSEEIDNIRLEYKSELFIDNIIFTMYVPSARGINSDGDPSKTSLLTTPKAGRTIAISNDLVEKGWLGKCVFISYGGIRRCSDRIGNKKLKNQVDICGGTLSEAYKFGRKRGQIIMIPDMYCDNVFGK